MKDKKLLLEGGAVKHMNHPFDLPWVKTGGDLLEFFTFRIPKYLETNPNPSVKIDGTNVSFKLIHSPTHHGEYQFAVDRGSMQPVDIEGITVDRTGEKWKNPDHGMRMAIEILLPIFNATLYSGEIDEELNILGMDQPVDPGLEYFFNTEYVLEEDLPDGSKKPINVIQYNEDFFAIHGVNKFKHVKSPVKGSISREGAEVMLSTKKMAALQNITAKVARFSKKFNVYGPEDTKASLVDGNINFDEALAKKVTIFLDESGDKQENTLGGWLRNSNIKNPFAAKVKIGSKDDGKSFHPKGQAGALSKFIYTAMLPDQGMPIPLSRLVPDPKDAIVAINGAIFMHATRLLGQAVLQSFTTKIGHSSVAKHEGLVLRSEEVFGTPKPVKVTGNFIVDGMGGNISDLMNVKEPAKKEADIKRKIAVIPGKFKPPHRGHLDMVAHYASIADAVMVLISPIPLQINDDTEIGREESEKIWRLYIEKAGLSDKVFIGDTTWNSPVRTCYEVLTGRVASFVPVPGDLIIPGASTKPDPKTELPDYLRFDRFHLGVEGQILGVIAAEAEPYAFTPEPPVLHGREFREAMKTGENIEEFLPADVSAKEFFGILGYNPNPTPTPEEPEGGSYPPPFFMGEMLYKMIEEAVNEQTEPFQKKMKAKHPRMKMRLIGKGGNKHTGGGKGHGKPCMKRGKSAPPMGEMSSMAGGAVEIGAVGKKKRKSLIREEGDELVQHILDYLLNKYSTNRGISNEN